MLDPEASTAGFCDTSTDVSSSILDSYADEGLVGKRFIGKCSYGVLGPSTDFAACEKLQAVLKSHVAACVVGKPPSPRCSRNHAVSLTLQRNETHFHPCTGELCCFPIDLNHKHPDTCLTIRGQVQIQYFVLACWLRVDVIHIIEHERLKGKCCKAQVRVIFIRYATARAHYRDLRAPGIITSPRLVGPFGFRE